MHVVSVDFSPNGQFLVSASWDRTVRLWRTRDGSSRELKDVSRMFYTVSFSLHGRYVFSGNSDRYLRIWDTRTHKLMAKWRGHRGDVWYVALSKDGKGLVSGGNDKVMKYWDVGQYADLGYGSASPIVNTSKVEEYKKEILKFEGHTVGSVPCGLVEVCSTQPTRDIFVRLLSPPMIDGFSPRAQTNAAYASGMQRQLPGSAP